MQQTLYVYVKLCAHMAGEGFQLVLNAKKSKILSVGMVGSWQVSLNTQPLSKNTDSCYYKNNFFIESSRRFCYESHEVK